MKGDEWNNISHRIGAGQRASLLPNCDVCRKNDGVDASGIASESVPPNQFLFSPLFCVQHNYLKTMMGLRQGHRK